MRADGGWPWLVGLTACGPVLYLAGWVVAAIYEGRPMAGIDCFDPSVVEHLGRGRIFLAAVMATGAVWSLMVMPWLLVALAFRRWEPTQRTAGAWSLAANSVALILVCLLLRQTVGIGRVSLLVGWSLYSGLLLLLVRTAGGSLLQWPDWRRRWAGSMAIGLAAVLLSLVLFGQEFFVTPLNGDGIETFELARSLQSHFLPYWEMEWVGRFGTDVTNPSLINSYWTFALQQLLGNNELAARLPYWLCWLGIFAVCLRMVRPNAEAPCWPMAVVLGLVVFLAGIWYLFFVGWNPYMADPANPGVTDAMFILFWLAALDCLRLKDTAGWVLLTVMASLVLYAGPVMFVLMSAAGWIFQPVPRRQMTRAILSGAGVLAVLTAFYLTWGWLDGSISGWWPTIYADYVDYYIRPIPRLYSAVLFAGYFLLGCGGIAAIGLVLPFLKRSPDRDDPSIGWDRTLAAVTVAYLLIVLGSGIKNLHYLGPLMLPPVILWLRNARGPVGRAMTAAAVVTLSIAVVLCWPRHREPFVLNRTLGAETTFLTDSYEEACGWMRRAEVTMDLYKEGQFGWYCGQHTWIHYAQLSAEPTDRRRLLVAKGAAPWPGYEPVFRWGDGVTLYCSDPQWLAWARRQQPPTGLDRCGPIFQPIAVGPFHREQK